MRRFEIHSSFFTSFLLNFLSLISIYWFFHCFSINACFLIKKKLRSTTRYSHFTQNSFYLFLMIFRYFGRINAICFHKMYLNKVQNTDWIHWNNAVNTINFSPFFFNMIVCACVCVCTIMITFRVYSSRASGVLNKSNETELDYKAG